MKLKEYLNTFRGKSVAVIGAGVSNTPLIDLLLEQGINVTVRDRRSREAMGAEAERFEANGAVLKLGDDYLDGLGEDVIFRTPGLMPSNPQIQHALKRGAILTSEMEAFFDVCPCKIIAVTGSDGKTTTTSIIAEMLKKQGFTVHVGGNIGSPLLCEANKIEPHDIVVLELSSFQLITMKKSPDVAVVTNIAPNHLDIHISMDEYVDAKRNIISYQQKNGRAVFNNDNEYTRGFSQIAAGEAVMFSRIGRVENGLFLSGDMILETFNGNTAEIMDTRDILLPGVHNIENFMAAFAAVRGIVDRGTMLETARTFKGVPHRIELIRELRGVRYYNDSIASSPTRTIAGLRAFDKKVILIAGGKDKGVPFDELGPEIVKHVKTLVLTGLTADKILKAVLDTPDYKGQPGIILRPDFFDAVYTAADAAGEGDIVLLSPACTSFDRFKNFEERGDTFREIVKGLK